MRSVRKLSPIPPDPKPSRKQVDAELRKHNFVKSVPPKRQREFSAFFWEADQRQKCPDLFWHPFAPEPMWYECYLKGSTVRVAAGEVKSRREARRLCCQQERRYRAAAP